MALSRDSILKHAGNYQTREVHVPNWADANGDDVVLVRGMTSREWDTHQTRVERNRANGKDQSNVTAQLIVRCVLNQDGTMMFGDKDVALVGELPIGDINRIGEAIIDLSGLTPESQDEIEGNSDGARSADSSSS